LIAILICVSTSSCKKDYDIDNLEQIIQESEFSIPDFYYRGTINDLVNNEDISINRETTVTEDVIDNLTFVESSSEQGTQTDNGYKFAASATGRRLPQYSLPPDSIINENILLGVTYQIIVKLVSEQKGDSLQIRFSKEELLNFLAEGNVMQFGSDPGQVEIAFDHLIFDDFPPYANRRYEGFSLYSPDTSEDTFEILKIEDYVDPPPSMTPNRGLIVTAMINCTLGNIDGEDFRLDYRLKDVEATFLFLYR